VGGRTRSRAALLAAAVLSGSFLVATAAAPASGAATARPDLGSVLADPPSPDYVSELGPGDTTLAIGPIANAGAMAAASSGRPADVRRQLGGEQFTRGYARWWFRFDDTLKGGGTGLYEVAAEFRRNAGAAQHLRDSKANDRSHPTFRGFFDTPGLAGGYGSHFVRPDGFDHYMVSFVKGNVLYQVSVVGYSALSPQPALDQSRRQLAVAPAETLPQPAGLGALEAPDWLLPATAALGIALVLAGLAVLLVRAVRRGGSWRAAALASVVSPPAVFTVDRRYWWDGASWRDSATSVPPDAPRSPDGQHWFDGSTWRPVPRAAGWPDAGEPWP
jgi:hypothetical protein